MNCNYHILYFRNRALELQFVDTFLFAKLTRVTVIIVTPSCPRKRVVVIGCVCCGATLQCAAYQLECVLLRQDNVF